MTTIVVSTYDVASKPRIGGHFWVYLQYVHGLQRLGCEVFWAEQFVPGGRGRDASAAATFFSRMEEYGVGGRAILYDTSGSGAGDALRTMGLSPGDAGAVFSRADALLNFHYAIEPEMLARFRRTALVDVDPGLLQFWISRGQLRVPPHDVYLTTGETVGTPGSRIPDCGLTWSRVRPPVSLDLWPFTHDPGCRRFTTVSSWLAGEYVTECGRVLYENDKRVSFLQFADLPERTPCELELAAYFEGGLDAEDRRLMRRHGWHLRHSLEVAGDPRQYRAYIRRSRGEFSCAKPSCIAFQNAWVSDRTLCYLASGKPAIVQHTGPSSFLPEAHGIFRFSTAEEAAAALRTVEADYERQCRAAREVAEAFFDSDTVLAELLDAIAAPGERRPDRPPARTLSRGQDAVT